MKRTNFNPGKHAFRFENRFENQVRVFAISKIPLIGSKFEVETNGLCGGMAFASLDYFHANRPIPETTSANATLTKYLLKRQLDSFKYKDSWRFFRWTRRSSNSVVSKTMENEIPKAKQSIDRGIPVVIGLIGATKVKNIGNDNHQVVCYGYHEDASGNTALYVYDPNCPPWGRFTGELRLVPFFHQSGAGTDVPDGPSGPVQTFSGSSVSSKVNRFRLERSQAGKKDSIWRGFFVQRYSPKSNPPDFGNTSRGNQSDTRRDHRDRDRGTTVRDHRNRDVEAKVRDHRK